MSGVIDKEEIIETEKTLKKTLKKTNKIEKIEKTLMEADVDSDEFYKAFKEGVNAYEELKHVMDNICDYFPKIKTNKEPSGG